MKSNIKSAVMDAVNEVLPKAMQSLQENFEKALKNHVSNKEFIERALQNAFLKEITDCLQCIICKDTSTSPVIVSSCCESVIGCFKCVKTWTDTGKTTCPKCREDGFNTATISLNSFDDFIKKLH